MNFDNECSKLTEPLRHRLQMLMYFGPRIGAEGVLERHEAELWIYQLVYQIWQEKKAEIKAMKQLSLCDYQPQIEAFLSQNHLPGYSVDKVMNYISLLAMDFNADMQRLEINRKSKMQKLFWRDKSYQEKEFQVFRRVCLEHLDNLRTIKAPFEFYDNFQIDGQIIRKYMAC